MESVVAISKVKKQNFEGVREAVRNVMTFAHWQEHIKGEKIFLKLNLMSSQVVPGQCTSPWFFESVLKEITETKPNLEIICGDADVAGTKQFDDAVKNWGIKEVADRYGVSVVNLSKLPAEKMRIGEKLGKLNIPKILMEVDCIVTLPVIKAHCLTTITGALKNQWGLLPRFRHRFHPIVNDAIPEINKFFNVTFAVADMTISMEGPGPRCGIPKICDLVLASADRVALDAAAATIMGFNPKQIGHIVNAEKIGIGTTNFVIVGDYDGKKYNFIFPQAKDHLVYRWRDRIQRISLLRKIFFDTPLFDILALLAVTYNTKIWYMKYGKKYAENICKNSGYGDEFSKLIGVGK